MVKAKPPRYPEGNKSNNSAEKHKGQAPNTKRYQGKKNRTNTQCMELEAETNFKGWSRYLEGYIFELGPRASERFPMMMKDMELYLGETYSDSFQPGIMPKTPATFPDPVIPTIIPDMGNECPKTEGVVAYIKKKNVDKAIHQKLRKKDVYETDMDNIYNIIVGQTN